MSVSSVAKCRQKRYRSPTVIVISEREASTDCISTSQLGVHGCRPAVVGRAHFETISSSCLL